MRTKRCQSKKRLKSGDSKGAWGKENQMDSGFLLKCLLSTSSGSLAVKPLHCKRQVLSSGPPYDERNSDESLSLSKSRACKFLPAFP